MIGSPMREMGLKATSVFNGLLHYVQGPMLLASRGRQIYRSENDGKNWDLLCRVPCGVRWQMKAVTRVGRRLFRAKVGHVLPVGEHRYLTFGFGQINVYDATEGRFLEKPVDLVGSRPLAVCQLSPSEILYGQYCSNRDRSPVSIWATNDGGRSWHEVYRFKHVRHIHGVYHDPYTDSVWVTTGDDDQESAIWVTTDRFETLRKVVFGSQQTRAVDLLFSPSHVYFGSDTPREANWLYRWDRQSERTERLQRVESSVFFGGRIGDWLLFSTAAEPSNVNRRDAVSVWGSQDGINWTSLLTLRKDAWPCRYFEYGQIRFPYGLAQATRLWLSPIALDGDERVLSCALPNDVH